MHMETNQSRIKIRYQLLFNVQRFSTRKETQNSQLQNCSRLLKEVSFHKRLTISVITFEGHQDNRKSWKEYKTVRRLLQSYFFQRLLHIINIQIDTSSKANIDKVLSAMSLQEDNFQF